MFYSFCRFLVNIFALRIKIDGKENIPKEGPVLLISNHTSPWDPIILGTATKRHISFMAKKELFENKLAAKIISKLGAFPVDRGNMDKRAIKQAMECLKGGNVLVVFPEGARSRGREMLPFQKGVALMAAKEDCVVVPVGIHNSEGVIRLNSGRVKATVGKPMKFEVQEGEKRHDAFERFLSDLQNNVKDLIDISANK